MTWQKTRKTNLLADIELLINNYEVALKEDAKGKASQLIIKLMVYINDLNEVSDSLRKNIGNKVAKLWGELYDV